MRLTWFLRETAISLRRNILMTIAAMLTAAVSLLLLGAVFTVGDLVRGVAFRLEEGVEVQVYLVDDATKTQRDEIQATLEDLSVVKKATYVTQEEAYDEYIELFSDEPVLIEGVTPDDLPASFKVAMSDPSRTDVVKSSVDKNPAVESVEDHRETVGRIVDFNRVLRRFSFGMIGVLFLAAVLLISNTIQIGIFARRKEIEIMKLVGATNWFVRIPFVSEGLFVGVSGGVAAFLILAAAKAAILGALPAFLPTPYVTALDPRQLGILVIIGAVIGGLGSMVAVRRYLDV